MFSFHPVAGPSLQILFSVIICALVTFVLAAWFISQRHVFKGPHINAELFKEAHNETLQGHQVIVGRSTSEGGAIAEEMRRKSMNESKQL